MFTVRELRTRLGGKIIRNVDGGMATTNSREAGLPRKEVKSGRER